jgi:hypothetical protein
MTSTAVSFSRSTVAKMPARIRQIPTARLPAAKKSTTEKESALFTLWMLSS